MNNTTLILDTSDLLKSVDFLNNRFNLLLKEGVFENNTLLLKNIAIGISELHFYSDSANNLVRRPLDAHMQLQTARNQTRFILVKLNELIEKKPNCISILKEIKKTTESVDNKIINIIKKA